MAILWSPRGGGAHQSRFMDSQHPASAFPEVQDENVLSDILFHFPRESGWNRLFMPGAAKDETSAFDFA
jgi:hypothetical protein